MTAGAAVDAAGTAMLILRMIPEACRFMNDSLVAIG